MNVNTFGGTVLDKPSRTLDSNEFQTDQGGERFDVARWKRRRGMRHTDTLKFSNTICGVFGFDLAGPNFAQMVITGANIYGIRNIGVQE